MKERTADNRVVAELITHLGRVASGDGSVSGLTAGQWRALRYFARANRFSRTVSGLAEFHATTRGTASQTVKGLVSDGYLTRTRSQADGRSQRLDSTDKTRTILALDPCEALVRAAGALPPGARGPFIANLERMLGHVTRERGKRPFGMCPFCEHLKGDRCCIEGTPSYECGLMQESLEAAELDQICVNFEPGEASAMRRAFAGEAS